MNRRGAEAQRKPINGLRRFARHGFLLFSAPLHLCGSIVFLAGTTFSLSATAGAQLYEPLAASVKASLYRSISDRAPALSSFPTSGDAAAWLAEMSRRLERKLPDQATRLDLLKSIHYEASRAGLDPELVLGLVEVESGFRKYAVSGAGARGYMQVMPFWQDLIGQKDNNLFHMRTNLRYGCTILRHYLDMEHGDLYRALGRYNGSLGKPEYPNMVRTVWERHWRQDSTSLALR